ncbi:MAG: SoxR reducing system RseC family protein [Sulfurisoma sp.]|nr:SoxR reducing system RseC family protein [Sulfurisoma sp.]
MSHTTNALTRSGRIVAIRDGLATIRVELPAGCTSCGSRGACASGKAATATVVLPAPAGARPGETVTLSITEGSLARSALLVYFLPAVTTLLGAVGLAGAGDVAAIGGAAAGLGLGLILPRLIGRSLSRSGGFTASVAAPSNIHSQPIGDFL